MAQHKDPFLLCPACRPYLIAIAVTFVVILYFA